MISVRSISKSYGDTKVLSDLSLDFAPGKVAGIVGDNGAGKTTLFRCLAGLESCEGEIASPLLKLKNHIGFLPTNPVFMSFITGWEYLKLLSVAREIKTDEFEAQNIFDLPLSQYADTYSTGMKKKLALMGILLQKNEVFILDEPFNGVDIHSNILIIEIIKELKMKNKIILISSHIFSTLSECCDEIHLLKNGKINRTVEKDEFSLLDEEMKSFIIGDRIKKLRIQ